MTADGADRGPIVVGTDGSDLAGQAVRWAADEAALRTAPLLIVHVYALVPQTAPHIVSYSAYRDAVQDQGRDLLAEAVAMARRRTPQVAVDTELCEGWPAQRLIELSTSAELVVLGSRGLGGFSGLLLGSTAVAVAGHGRCPVVVARGREQPIEEPARPVVVGVDGSPAGAAAIPFAFAAAARRRTALVAVHSWLDHHLGTGGAAALPSVDWDRVQAEQAQLLDQQLGRWRTAFPAVPVRSVVVCDRPAVALLAQAEQAQLVVVGTRGRGGFRGLVLGSTSQALIYHAPCPVAVVPPGR